MSKDNTLHENVVPGSTGSKPDDVRVRKSCTSEKTEQKVGNGQQQKRRCSGAMFAVLSACLGAASLGTIIGYASPAVPSIQGQHNSFHLNSHEDISWFVSITPLGEVLGAAISGPLVDKFGRKTVLIINAVPMVFGWLLITASRNLACAYLGRFVTGLSGGVMDVVVPVYITEVSPTDIRGLFGSCYELFVNLGMFYAFAFGCVLNYNWLAIACAVIPAVMMVLMCFMPETPRWLMAHGFKEAAAEVLHRLRGEDADISAELGEIQENVQLSLGKVTWRDFLQPSIYKPLFIVLTLMFVHVFSGYGFIYEYTVSIFSSAGVDLNPYAQTAIVGLAGVLSNFLTAFLVDHLGRRVMLLLSLVIMAVSLTAMGAFFKIKEMDESLALNDIFWLPVLCLVLYSFGCNIGCGPIIFYMASELFPLKTRGLTCGISITTWSFYLFVMTKYFMNLIPFVMEYGLYWIMSLVSVFGIVFVLVKVPETSGKSLEEIEKMFRGEN